MTQTVIAEGIEAIDTPTPAPVEASTPAATAIPEDLAQGIRNIMHEEFSHFLGDVERRLGQTRELERSMVSGSVSAGRTVHTEDLNVNLHFIDGYTMTANTPSSGYIAWTAVHIVFAGVDYTIADGNTNKKYAWFVKPGTGTAATLQTGDTKPVLGPNDCLVFFNNAGTPVNALTSSIPVAVVDGAIDNAALAQGAVTSDKTNFYTTLTTAITNAQNKADAAMSVADGEISTYFQGTAPWPNGDATAGGAVTPSSRTGDMWMDDDGVAYRWTGPAGTPANSWKVITDNALSKALADAQAANTLAGKKTTTFYKNFADTPTANAAGDTWVVLDQDRKTKYATAPGTANWVDALIGTQAIADNAISNAKIGTNIDGSKLQSGTVTNTQLGSGIDGAKLVTASVTATQIGTGAITPTKINTLQHIMF